MTSDREMQLESALTAAVSHMRSMPLTHALAAAIKDAERVLAGKGMTQSMVGYQHTPVGMVPIAARVDAGQVLTLYTTCLNETAPPSVVGAHKDMLYRMLTRGYQLTLRAEEPRDFAVFEGLVRQRANVPSQET